DARVLAADAQLGWESPGDWVGVDGIASYQDARNTSSTGPGALFEGDRIPNLPYFQASGTARARFRSLASRSHLLEVSWTPRHVREFFLGWESAGQTEIKLEIPRQTQHAAALSYVWRSGSLALTNAFECQNLTDERAFDFYGVQRPGRSFHWKMTLD